MASVPGEGVSGGIMLARNFVSRIKKLTTENRELKPRAEYSTLGREGERIIRWWSYLKIFT